MKVVIVVPGRSGGYQGRHQAQALGLVLVREADRAKVVDLQEAICAKSQNHPRSSFDVSEPARRTAAAGAGYGPPLPSVPTRPQRSSQPPMKSTAAALYRSTAS
ncbi:hypothetical protein GUJ93_ZPchr0139g33507 [Zizania palustris]|uniref:Uncharacterized protein n=1 Tax=Zizania palustris TaxID=103762 RepID=A0A8J5VGI1_ZIZPA|nr:hypothetical protein GUJ93_ZPchr0139g33507 [Zizania palustris]